MVGMTSFVISTLSKSEYLSHLVFLDGSQLEVGMATLVNGITEMG